MSTERRREGFQVATPLLYGPRWVGQWRIHASGQAIGRRKPGGGERIRTATLLLAKQALSRSSYAPKVLQV